MIRIIGYELCSAGEGNGNTLELLDEKQDCFAQITIDEHNERHLTVFETPRPFCVPLSELKKAIEVAEKEVMNFDIDNMFEEQ